MTLTDSFHWMSILGNHAKRCLKMVVNFVDVLVQALVVEQLVDKVVPCVLNYEAAHQFQDECVPGTPWGKEGGGGEEERGGEERGGEGRGGEEKRDRGSIGCVHEGVGSCDWSEYGHKHNCSRSFNSPVRHPVKRVGNAHVPIEMKNSHHQWSLWSEPTSNNYIMDSIISIIANLNAKMVEHQFPKAFPLSFN